VKQKAELLHRTARHCFSWSLIHCCTAVWQITAEKTCIEWM